MDECSTALGGVAAWTCECAPCWLVLELKMLLRSAVNQHSTLPHPQAQSKMTHTMSDAMWRDMVLAWTHLNSVGS